MVAVSAMNSPARVGESLVVTVAEASRLLGIQEAAVRGLIHNGRIRAARLGGGWVWKIKRADLEAYVDAELAAQEARAKPRSAKCKRAAGR